MARPLRINIAGGLFHIMQRGNARQRIFLSDRDRHAFLERLARCSRLFECRIHAYCLMENHLHLLVETEKPNLSAFAQRLFASYTLWFNHRHDRVGHLLQGRFKSIIVEKDAYLLVLSRYIHLNPVKARLVERPEQYRWSSMGSYSPAGRRDNWVDPSTLLAYFDGSRERYRTFVYEGIEEPFEPKPIGQAFLGSDRFVERMRATATEEDGQARRDSSGHALCAAASGERLLQAVEQEFHVGMPVLRSPNVRSREFAEAKAVAAYLLRQHTPLTFREIGQLLGHISGQAVERAVRRVTTSPGLQKRAKRLIR